MYQGWSTPRINPNNRLPFHVLVRRSSIAPTLRAGIPFHQSTPRVGPKMIAALAERPPRPVSCLFSLANQGTNIVEVPALFRGAVMGICFVEDPICTYCVESPMMCMCMDICEWETCDRYIPLACMSCVIVSITLVGLTDATIPTLARRSHRQCGRQCSFVLCKSQITPAQFRRAASQLVCNPAGM